MNITKSLPICFAIAALQACSSSSDMGGMQGVATPSPAQEIPGSTDSDSNTDPQTSAPGVPMPDTDADSNNEPDSGNEADIDVVTETDADNEGQDENAEVADAQLVANADNVACAASAAEFESTMLAVINESRSVARMCGDESRDAVGTVFWNNELAQAAVNHADDMVTHNFFSHDGSDGLSVSHRADAVGYNWRAIGENIAAGQRDIGEVHQGWLDSPGHCRNIMNNLYTEVGAACVITDTADYGTYWVVVFGDQP